MPIMLPVDELRPGMYLARNLTRHSLEEIGGYFGGRDHTTVMHANRTIESMREKNPLFQATLEKLTEDISAGLPV